MDQNTTAQRVRRVLEDLREICRDEAKKAQTEPERWVAARGWENIADDIDEILDGGIG